MTLINKNEAMPVGTASFYNHHSIGDNLFYSYQ